MIWSISDTLLMIDACLAALAKLGGLLNFVQQLVDFLKSWYDVQKHIYDIFFCLQKNSFSILGISFAISYKAQKKAIFKALRTSKNLKYMEDFQMAIKVCLTDLRDQ